MLVETVFFFFYVGNQLALKTVMFYLAAVAGTFEYLKVAKKFPGLLVAWGKYEEDSRLIVGENGNPETQKRQILVASSIVSSSALSISLHLFEVSNKINSRCGLQFMRKYFNS